jgi:hypothetical protein
MAALGQRGLDEARRDARLLGHLLDGDHREVEVVAREAGHGDQRVAHAEGLDDVFTDLVGRGRGERAEAWRREVLVGLAEALVLGAEVVAPVRDAVGFVDREERNRQAAQARHRAFVAEALGRDVEELQLAGARVVEDAHLLVEADGRVEHGGRDAAQAELVDLVLHEGDERRHDERHAGQQRRRELIAEGLAAARRHHAEDRAPLEDGGDEFLLAGAEGVEAPVATQGGPRRRGGVAR